MKRPHGGDTWVPFQASTRTRVAGRRAPAPWARVGDRPSPRGPLHPDPRPRQCGVEGEGCGPGQAGGWGQAWLWSFTPGPAFVPR